MWIGRTLTLRPPSVWSHFLQLLNSRCLQRICIIICFPARMEFRIRMLRCKRKEQNPTWKEMPNREYSPEWLHIFTVSSNLSVQPLRLISMSLIFLPSNRDHSNSFAFRLPIALCITSHFFVKCCIGPL